MRKEYTLTENEEYALYSAIEIGSDAVCDFWIDMGLKYGFNPDSVGPVIGKSPMCLMADEV